MFFSVKLICLLFLLCTFCVFLVMAGCGDSYYLGGLPEQLILPELELLSQQMSSIKTALKEARPMERFRKLEQELESYKRLEEQIENTRVEQETAYRNLENRAQQVQAKEEGRKQLEARLQEMEGWCNEYAEERKRLKGQILDLESHLTQLTFREEKRKTTISALKQTLMERDLVIVDLQEKLAGAENVLSSRMTVDREEVEGLSREKEQVMATLDERSRDCSRLGREVHRLMDILSSEKTALYELQQENRELRQKQEASEDDQAKEDVEKWSALVRDKDMEIEVLSQKNSSLLQVVTAMSQQEMVLADLIQERDNLQEQVGMFQADREQFLRALEAKHSEIQEIIQQQMQFPQSSYSKLNKEMEREERRGSEPEETPVTRQVEKAVMVSSSDFGLVPCASGGGGGVSDSGVQEELSGSDHDHDSEDNSKSASLLSQSSFHDEEEDHGEDTQPHLPRASSTPRDSADEEDAGTEDNLVSPISPLFSPDRAPQPEEVRGSYWSDELEQDITFSSRSRIWDDYEDKWPRDGESCSAREYCWQRPHMGSVSDTEVEETVRGCLATETPESTPRASTPAENSHMDLGPLPLSDAPSSLQRTLCTDQTGSSPSRHGFWDSCALASSSTKTRNTDTLSTTAAASCVDAVGEQVTSPLSSVLAPSLDLVSQASAPSSNAHRDNLQPKLNLPSSSNQSCSMVTPPPGSNPDTPASSSDLHQHSYMVNPFSATSTSSDAYRSLHPLRRHVLTETSSPVSRVSLLSQAPAQAQTPEFYSPVPEETGVLPQHARPPETSLSQRTVCPLTPESLGLPQHSRPPNHGAEY